LCKTLAFFLLSFSSFALEPKSLAPFFVVHTEPLEKGEVHLSAQTLTMQQLTDKFPDWLELDGARVLETSEGTISAGKWAQVIERPVAFFNEQRMLDKRWLEASLKLGKLTRVDENSFKGTDPRGNFELEVFFDSDDMSNLQSGRLIRSLGHAKKLDPLTGGAAASVCVLLKRRHSAELSIMNYVSLSSRRTLEVGYYLGKSGHQGWGEDFAKEILARAKLAQRFKD
jgi:hypothetical protein